MKCKKCGQEDWYVRGKYKRCIPCHNKAQLASYHNRKLGIEKQRKSTYKSRPLAEQLKLISQKKMQAACTRGHNLTGDDVRLEIDSKGRMHRRCLKCERLRSRKRYGLETPSEIAQLLGGKVRPWEGLEDIA